MKKFFSLLVAVLCSVTLPALGQLNHLVISQVYGGGGNSGGVYVNDFIELYNPTSGPLSTNGLSVQYASSTGNFSAPNTFALPSATIQPGRYYLIEASAGANTSETALPTPDADASSTLLLSGTTGKVALVNGTTPLAGNGCPLSPTAVVDFVGWGSGANCSEGGAPAPGTANATAAIRTNPAIDTDNNGADFTAGTPVAHNSSFGAPTGALGASGVASPASVNAGQQTTLTVSVTPATSPNSTGITVVGDLRLIGGSQTQAFTDNGDGSFSFTAVVTTSTNGGITLPISVSDGQNRTTSTTITVTAIQPTPTITISEIQGEKSLSTATVSPYANQKVTTTGVVTAVLSNAFFIQSQSPDGDPLTPEGVEVFTSSKPPAAAAIGNLVSVTGTVTTYPDPSLTHTPATEISGSPTVTLVTPNVQLPTPIVLSATTLAPTGGLYQLTPYEGMRVSIASVTAVSGTNGSISDANEDAEMATSTGYFYGVIGNTTRPFREPGIDLRDPTVPGRPANVKIFDDNPERILIDSIISGGTSLEISTGAILPNVTGVLDFTFSQDSFYDPSRLILDASYDRTQVTPGMQVQPVPPAGSNEFTVASFNIERFYNTDASDNIYWVPQGVNGSSSGKTATSEAATLTSSAYSRRLQKVSLAIRNVLNSPDIVTIEEVENQKVATDIANQINTDAGVSNLYTGYSTDNTSTYTQDGTGISVGFLVKNTVTASATDVTQFGQNEIFTPSTSSSPITLNDRPWLVLNAGIKRAGAKDYPVTVIVNHMKALTGVNSPTSTSTRQKKELQAEDIAKYIQTLQAAGKHVISGGDFNAFEFSDGYTDTLATYTNTGVLPADQVVQPGVPDLVTPPLTDMALTLTPDQRWSYVEDGSAQILDHLVVTPDLVAAGAHMAYAHLDADFPATAYNDATTPARSSDHDVAVGYFPLPALATGASLSPASANFGNNALGIPSAGQVFTLANNGEAALAITSIAANGDYAATNNCGSSLDTGMSCTINVVLTPTAAGTRTGVLTVVTSGGTYTSSLTGVVSGLDFTIGGPNGSSGGTPIKQTVTAGSSATVALTFTPVGGATTITLICNGPSPAPAGTNCTAPSAPFTISGAAVSQTITISTTSRVATSGLALTVWPRSPWIAAGFLGLSGLLMLFAARSRRLGQYTVRIAGLLALLLAICIPATGCGGSSTTPPAANAGGTPAGTYTYTVTAYASNGTTHTQTISLTVQ